MIPDGTVVVWKFGGPLAGWSAPVSWIVLGGAALIGLAFVSWTYHYALAALTPARRRWLSGLRGLTWLGLMVILAAPNRVQRFFAPPPAVRPLAVLVDESDSMTTPDNRGLRRVDDALRRWRALAPAARRVHAGATSDFAFANGVKSAPPGDLPSGLSTDETHLFKGLRQVLQDAPAGGWGSVVVLTDGLDTSGAAWAEGSDAVVRTALGSSTALYFVPGRNRYAGGPFLSVRDVEVPDAVSPRTVFRVEATFDSFQRSEQSADVMFSINGVRQPAPPLRLAAGRRLATWSSDVSAGEPGELELELRVGEQTVRATVQVAPPSSRRILYFQGALDWSYRFLADSLMRDSTFSLTPVFNLPNREAVLPPGALRRLPAIPEGLERFDIVILANATADQFSAAEQTALGEWVRGGGVVLFFTPDDDSTQGFAGSELEQMLPVWFKAPGSTLAVSSLLASSGSGRRGADERPLTAFAWENTSRVREIFAGLEARRTELISPLFAEFAHIAGAKPGADVLARHPTEAQAEDGGDRAILFALQRYGRGQSGVLATDALWRWRMHEPADNRDPGLFWQTLFNWLTRERRRGLRFESAPRLVDAGNEVAIRVAGADTTSLQVAAEEGHDRVRLLEFGDEGTSGVFRWTPARPGMWRLSATDATGMSAHQWITVKAPAERGERSGAPPDEALLRDLAARTGGAVLESTPPIAWSDARASGGEPLGERAEPLWHRGWIFGLILGTYLIELGLRRKWRML